MAAAQLGATLRHIRDLAADPNLGEQNDGALLRAFLSRNDQAAFEVLVRRHGPMVLRVCRRTLGNASDAEDALQATFLVLARQAASIRKRESLASWLHGVAYRMAADARKAAARRHKHEARVNPTPPPDPALSAVWREMQVLLDEEIARLPETLRTPFVLCCLENHSCAEAARRLDLEEGAVAMRLSRARKRLQGRLAKRGVALASVLAAVALGAHGAAAAVPRPLVAAIVKAAAQAGAGQALAGAVSGKVLALAEGVQQAMSLNKWKTAILLLACTAALGTGLGTAILRPATGAEPEAGARREPPGAPPAGANKERQPPAGAAAKPAAGEGVKVGGRVLDPDGKPLAGAKLYLNAPGARKSPYPVRATSGADGRFELRCARSELAKAVSPSPSPWLAGSAGPKLMAVAKGYGCDWASVDADAKAGELTLRLVKDLPINGRVLDQDGKPVVGAKVRVHFVNTFKRARGPGLSQSWAGPLPEQAAVVTTKEDGRFRLSGFGRERMVGLHIEGPAIEYRGCAVLTRLGPNKPDAMGPFNATFDYVAAPSRPIRGVVRDAKTGKPLAGVGVNLSPGFPRPPFAVHTDRHGRYELLGYRKAPKYDVGVRPADGQVYFGGVFELTDTEGLTPLTADIELVPGIALRGRVTDKATGKPIPQAVVTYYALFPNANRRKLADKYKQAYSETVTGPDGSYRLGVFPGPGVLAVTAADRGMYTPAFAKEKEIRDVFGGARIRGQMEDALLLENFANGMSGFATQEHNALVLLNPGAKADSLKRDVVLERGLTLRGSVVGPDGRPLTGAKVWNTIPYLEEYLEGDAFTVRGLSPRRSRPLVFHHQEKDLGGGVVVRGDEKGSLTVKLQRHGDVTGRIVDKNGKPMPRVRLFCRVKDTRLVPPKLTYSSITDGDGRFRVKGLTPGLEHQLGMVGPAPRVVSVVAEPGKTKDLGDVKMTAD